MWKIAFKKKWLLFHIATIVGILFCLRLGVWQWIRRERVDQVTGETVINLQSTFYAFQWIFFAVALAWFWYRFFKDEYLVSIGQLKKGAK